MDCRDSEWSNVFDQVLNAGKESSWSSVRSGVRRTVQGGPLVGSRNVDMSQTVGSLDMSCFTTRVATQSVAEWFITWEVRCFDPEYVLRGAALYCYYGNSVQWFHTFQVVEWRYGSCVMA